MTKIVKLELMREQEGRTKFLIENDKQQLMFVLNDKLAETLRDQITVVLNKPELPYFFEATIIID